MFFYDAYISPHSQSLVEMAGVEPASETHKI